MRSHPKDASRSRPIRAAQPSPAQRSSARAGWRQRSFAHSRSSRNDEIDAASCSVIYEELLKVGCGGDFKRLLVRWHAERAAKARGERVARLETSEPAAPALRRHCFGRCQP
jgi:hypothetical protein